MAKKKAAIKETPKSSCTSELDSEPSLEDVDFTEFSLEQQVNILAQGITAFCNQVYDQGVEPDVVATVLLSVYCELMADLGDRDQFEEQLAAALDEDWDTYSIH